MIKREVNNVMKKTLLFVIDSLDTAGAEKSLVTLLSMLDYSRYSVDLQLFSYGHALESLVPQEVNILKPLKYTEFTKLGLRDSLSHAVKALEFGMLTSRIKYSMRIRKRKYSNPQKAILFWQSVCKVIEVNPKTYDVAISYAQGVPTYYVAEKVRATNKIAWVNVSYQLNQYEKKIKEISITNSTRLSPFPNQQRKCWSMHFLIIRVNLK